MPKLSAMAMEKARDAVRRGFQIAESEAFIHPLPSFALRFDGLALEQSAGAWISVSAAPPSPYPKWAAGSGEPETPAMVWPNLRRRASPEEWAYVFARLRLHLALNHLDPAESRAEWHYACWLRAEEMASRCAGRNATGRAVCAAVRSAARRGDGAGRASGGARRAGGVAGVVAGRAGTAILAL